jgi:hypothetical protein
VKNGDARGHQAIGCVSAQRRIEGDEFGDGICTEDLGRRAFAGSNQFERNHAFTGRAEQAGYIG